MSAAQKCERQQGSEHRLGRAREVLRASLQLGCTSFGGPIAHLGYFERAYVRQRRWLSGEEYASLVALCQMLPGPASSQVGFLIGLRHAGWLGGLAAWLGFTLPSALFMYVCAIGLTHAEGPAALSALHGLKLVAVAVVAQAVWSMARKLCPDRPRIAIALAAASFLLIVGSAGGQLIVLVAGAVAGMVLCRHMPLDLHPLTMPVSRQLAWIALALCAVLLFGLPLLAARSPHGYIALASLFYRAGALVFGGGHVVLPLLREAMVPDGWITDDRFLAGYGLAQAVPGPLFTLGTYLGAANRYTTPPLLGAVVAGTFIFLPGLLLATAGAALWSRFARHQAVRSGIVGINATVVGILGAALYDPVWISAIHSRADMAIAAVALMLLEQWKAPPIVVVALCVASSIVETLL